MVVKSLCKCQINGEQSARTCMVLNTFMEATCNSLQWYRWNSVKTVLNFLYTGLDFIIKDLPSVLILIHVIADQIFNDKLCCSYRYNWCLCRFI